MAFFVARIWVPWRSLESLRTQGSECAYGWGSWVLLSSYSGSKWDDSLKMGRATKDKGWQKLILLQFTLQPLWYSEILGTQIPFMIIFSTKVTFYMTTKGAWTWLSGYDEDMLVGLGFTTVPVPSTSNNLSIPYKKLKKWKFSKGAPRLLAAQFRQNFARTMTQINCRLCQFPSGEVGNLKKHIKSEHEVIIKK